MFWRGIVLAAAIFLSGCVSDQVGTDYAAIAQKVGPPKPGQSRIVVLQEKRQGLSMALCACDMKLDGDPIGKVIVGTYVYADRPTGRHQLVASEALFPGETRREFATESGRTYYFLIRSSERHDAVTGGALMGSDTAELKATVGARLQKLWPQIGEVKFDYVWNGYVGMTTDFLPRIHRLGPNGFAWAGCNGRAVALSIAIGRELAKAAQGVADHDLALPFTEPSPYVAHGLLRRLAPLMLMVYRRRDAAEIPEVPSGPPQPEHFIAWASNLRNRWRTN